jgi:hypothetical protein
MDTRPEECGILVLVHARDETPDPVIAQAVARLEAGGLKPRGLLQHGEPGCGKACATLYLDDIGMQRQVCIFEDRGPQARGCRLDTAGLTVAAGWLREAVEALPDVLFVNRFGKHEGEGRGLREEIDMAVAAGIPTSSPSTASICGSGGLSPARPSPRCRSMPARSRAGA